MRGKCFKETQSGHNICLDCLQHYDRADKNCAWVHMQGMHLAESGTTTSAQ